MNNLQTFVKRVKWTIDWSRSSWS